MKNYIAILMVLLFVCGATGAQAQDCSDPDGVTGEVIYNQTHNVIQYCNGTVWRAAGKADAAAGAGACTDPAGDEGEIIYNSNYKVSQFCNGTVWVGMGSLTAPAATGCDDGGFSYGGYCWYLGALNESCTSVCSTHGGYNLATRDFAGSAAGSDANCQALASTVGGGVYGWGGNSCPSFGCVLTDLGAAYRCTMVATTAGSSDPNASRFCACNN